MTDAKGQRGRGATAAGHAWACWPLRGRRMDRVREFLDDLKQHGYGQGHFLGLLNVLIGRSIGRADGPVLSSGLTWRESAALLKKVRWERDAVRELGQDPAELPPRERERYWYVAIARAQVDSPQATEAGDRLAERLRGAGYVIGPAPK